MRRLLWVGLDGWLLATLAIHVLVRAAYADFVPLYDSRQYFDECLLRAAAGPFDLRALDCFGHSTSLFMGLVLLVQRLDLGSVLLLHATTAALGLASIVAFARLAERLIVAPELLWERRALVACYALGPSCLAGGVNFSPDYGVLAFFVLMLERMLAGRFALAALWGTCLVLSKETGVLLCAAASASFALHSWIRPQTYPPRRELVRAALLLATPLLVFGSRALLIAISGAPALWGGERTHEVLLPMFLRFELLAPTFLAYAFDVLALGYNWILGLPVVLLGLIAAARSLAALPPLHAPGFEPRAVRVVMTLSPLAFLLLTRFTTVNNVRYLFALSPLFVLTAGYALVALGLRPVLRRALLGLALVLTFSFNFHSLDPISRAFFGSYAFGGHEMLRGAAFDVCCGYGRDQSVYNLQFTELHYLQNEVYRALRPGPETVLVAHKQATVQLAGRIDEKTFERTLRVGPGTRALNILGVSDVLEGGSLPERIQFMALPNFDNAHAYARLMERYALVQTRAFWRGGYALFVHELRRKS